MASHSHHGETVTANIGAGNFEREAIGGRGTMLMLLACVLLFQQADVVMFSMTSEAIRSEFHFTDAQMGMLNGSAIALFYACASIPLARIADRGRRRNVIAISLALWSLFTALTAFASSFEAFFLIRLMVGIGEAGAMPAAFSLIAARFPPRRRAGAMSLVQAGRYVGMIVGLSGAGFALALFGWRHTFLLFGLPGIVLAIIFYMAVSEPRDVVSGDPSPIGTVIRVLNRRTILHLFALLATASTISYGMLAWAPAFYQRSFGMKPGEVGLWLGIVLGLGNLVGTLIGGYVTDRIAKERFDGGLRLAFWTIAINFPLAILAFCATDKWWSLGLLLASSVSGTICVAPVFATLQTLTPAKFRATAVALITSGVSFSAVGMGPLIVGGISDMARALVGEESLRWSLIIVTSFGFWPLFHAWRVNQLCPAELRDPAE